MLLDRRWFLKLLSAGVPGAALTESLARALQIPASIGRGGQAENPMGRLAPSASGKQSNWRWCGKCQGLAYAGGRRIGRCPAGGDHDHGGSGNYVLNSNIQPIAGRQQGNWRWCNKCQCLTFAGARRPGGCPAGGAHDHTGSGDYVLTKNVQRIRGGQQNNWLWCNKCQCLTFAGTERLGRCQNGGSHDHAGSDNYVLDVQPG